MGDVSIAQAKQGLADLVRRAAADHERFTIVDGGAAAVLVGAEEYAELEEAAALADFLARRAADPTLTGVPHSEVRARLGLPSEPTRAAS